MSLLPGYTHIINPRLKHTYLSFDEEGELVIKSPKVSLQYIEQLLIKKSAWINRSREKIRSKKGRAVNFSHEPRLYFKGETFPLMLIPREKKHCTLTFDQRSFQLYYHHYDTALFEKHINRFYKQSAEVQIPALVDLWAEKMQLSPQKISFRKTKRQWGSCSRENRISFNTMMMKLPQNVIEYIIVHELAHIRHKHHQKSFWHCVEKAMPDYRSHRAELKHYTTY